MHPSDRRHLDRVIQYLFWGLLGPLIFLNIWLLGQLFRFFEHVVTVSALAAILALLLNYPVQWLGYFKIRRSLAIAMVALTALTLLILLGIAVVPSLVNQATDLLQQIPKWLTDSQDQIDQLAAFTRNRRLPIDLNQVTKQLETFIQTVLNRLPDLAIGTLGRLFDTVLVIVLAFYMLLYGQRTWIGLTQLLPNSMRDVISRSLQFNFQQFFISQLLLAAFMFLNLAVVFFFLRVNFGLLLALTVGVFELIPFIGATLGIGLVVLIVLLQNSWLALWVAIWAMVLQQIKDNLIAPKLLGEFIGLSPLWVLIALLVGGRVAGLLGILLSVPIAGTIKSAVEQIRNSPSDLSTTKA